MDSNSDSDSDETRLLSPKKQSPPSRERRRSFAPPLRLAWPGGGVNGGGGVGHLATLCTSQSQLSNASSESAAATSAQAASSRDHQRRNINKSKRKIKNADTGSKQPSSRMWVEKYTPSDSQRLCVAPKKVKQVRSWIENALLHRERADKSTLMVLVGSPGVGKSTMIRVLANEMKLNLQEWNDASFSSHRSTGQDGMLSVNHASALTSFQHFLRSSGVGYHTVCSSSIPESPLKKQRRQPKQNNTLYEGKSIILLEELPNLYSSDAEETFRNIMSEHIQQSQVPTILIFSDVCEGKHRPADLERLIPSKQLYSSAVEIVQCHVATRARMKSSLDEIARGERMPPLSASELEEIHLSSGGDIRHAVMSLQFRLGGSQSKHTKRRKSTGPSQPAWKGHDRDTRLSTFHALGKLLYAKREPPLTTSVTPSKTATNGSSNILLEQRPPLKFDPERVMDESTINHGGALTFLEYHSPEFFTDVTELSPAFDHFSDAAMFLDKSMNLQRDHGDTIYPNGYVSSLAGRTVANANRHAAPNKFRSFTAPKVFEVMKKARGNQMSMQQLSKRLSVGTKLLALETNLGSSRSFITHNLPFMRTIVPHEVDAAVNNLFSFVSQKETDNDASRNADRALKTAILEQDRILATDDIVDEDSDDAPS